MSIVNLETGKASEFRLFPNESSLTCFVKLTDIEVIELVDLPDDYCEIVATGTGMDSVGHVFKVQLLYSPETLAEKEQVLAGIQVDRYYSACGQFSFVAEEGMLVYDAKCRELSDEEATGVDEVFRVNEVTVKAAQGNERTMSDALREELVKVALEWQEQYGVAPAITSTIAEYDAAKIVGMTDEEYSRYMQDKTAVCRGHDFIHGGLRYQIKAHRPSGKKGSTISNAGKARNYDWDVLIWIRYNMSYDMQEAWSWDRQSYMTSFDSISRISPADMRRGTKIG
jgi:hypothetical protein